jgi:deoxyadenosine/deoxycytidine kinase|tara:strand:+ start:195 stop:836 length:642 start_codon:yes stop_codon:yes gene_type:complete
MAESLIKISSQIAIAGNIGAGKTTMTNLLADFLHLEPVFESVEHNPYLADFYDDMSRWSFNLQIFFLHNRFSNQIKLMKLNKGFIQDRSIYEDREIFARNLKDLNFMSSRDWSTYTSLFDDMVQFIREPDLIIYLKASTQTLIGRIKNRNRVYEKDISSEYIHSLNIYYEKWISKIESDKVLIIDTNNFNIFEDKVEFENIKEKIINKFQTKC